MKILILGSQHGNETLGAQLYRYIKKYHQSLLQHVSYKLANPRAFRENIRYIDTDMNRSYDKPGNSYEERRASKLLQFIDGGDFDLVLDMHTTLCIQPPSLIVADVNPSNDKFIYATSIDKIVIMKHKIANHSLNKARQHVVSIELNHEVTSEALESLCQDIKRYIDGEVHPTKKYVYKITELIRKVEVTSVEAKTLRNFEYSDKGFYPVLVGENSYKKQTNYLGFKATEQYELNDKV